MQADQLRFWMPTPRIIFESSFSLELRATPSNSFEAFGQAAYLLIYAPEMSCFLINPNETQQIPKSENELMLLRLSPQLLIETATRLKFYRSGSNLLFSHPNTSDKNLMLTLAAIQVEARQGSAGWREVIKSQVNQLTVYLLRSHINLQRSEDLELSRVGIVDRRLRRAIEFMHDNCGRELSLAEIAASVFVSEFHFARLFKKITGTSPHAYLASMRIQKAQKLLAETDLTLTEIGARVGYNSQSHFTKIFREATGLTPKAFRASGTK